MHSSGIAIFEDKELQYTGAAKVASRHKEYDALERMTHSIIDTIVERPDVLVIEEQVYRKGKERMSIKSFKFFASLTYMLAFSIQAKKTFMYSPVQWKGTIPKEKHHKRIYKQELKLKTPLHCYADMQPDIMDAIGIGRYYLAKIKS